MPKPNDPALVHKALAKAQGVEARLNDLISNDLGPQSPSVMYTTTSTVVQQTTGGSYTWTCPAGVTSVRVQVWGAGAGAGGGNSSHGGEGGGGGAYAEEPAYPVVPGTVYSYLVGDGGDGGTTGNPGHDAGDSWFDNPSLNAYGVYAFGGDAGSNLTGGNGGVAGTNTIAFAGGNGGGDGTQSTGGCGGGSSASPAAAGHNGAGSTSSTGGAGGADLHGADQGAGGNGGNSAANGSNGSSPGGGGGGCGASTGSSQVTFNYNPTASCTYYGSDAQGGNANNKRTSVGSTMYQGGTTSSGGTYNGTMKSVMLLPSSVQSDLSGVTIDSCTFRMHNQHSWYSSGMTVVLGYGGFTTLGSSFSGGGITNIKSYATAEGADHTTVLTSFNLPAALKSGAAKALVLGLAPAYNLSYYGYFSGAGSSDPPLLVVTGHTGSAQVIAGSGSDGEVRITYTTNTTPVASLQATSTTDDSGNALGAGFTGLASAFQPSSNPSVVEFWHSVGATGEPAFSSGWANLGGGQVALQFKLLPTNAVHIIGVVSAASSTTTTMFTLPAGYRPTSQVEAPVAPHTGTVTGLFLAVNTSGTVVMTGSSNTSGNITINAIIPLDSN